MKRKLLTFFLTLAIGFLSISQEIPDEGSFVPSYYIGKSNFNILNANSYKKSDYDTLVIRYKISNYDFGGFSISGIRPGFIMEKELKDDVLVLKCSLEEPFAEKDLKKFIRETELLTIKITIIDNDEIIFDDFSYPKGTHFYRISGPAKIPVKEGTINDTRVRLRTKPNLSSETWGFLSTGDKVKVKDKSAEKYEIDGESWYWYKVDHPNYPDGWVYGKYVDIVE